MTEMRLLRLKNVKHVKFIDITEISSTVSEKTYRIRRCGRLILSINFEPKTKSPPPKTSPTPMHIPTNPTAELGFSKFLEFPTDVV